MNGWHNRRRLEPATIFNEDWTNIGLNLRNGLAVPDVVARRRRRFAIIHNRLSGRQRGRLLDAVCHELTAAGCSVTVEVVERFADLADRSRYAAASGAFDAVVAAGGDGTIRAVAAPLIGTGMALGVIPIGTANVLASEMRLPRRPKAIAHMLMHGTTTAVSCGSLDGEPFLLMASAGFDANVLRRLDHGLKRTLGKLAYAGPILGELARRPVHFEAMIDGQPHTCTWLIVTNARHYAGSFVLAAGRNITAPGFDAVVISAPTRLRFFRVLLAIATGRIGRNADAKIVACRQVEVSGSSNLPIQIDGDAAPRDRLRVSAAKATLKLIVPAGDPGQTGARSDATTLPGTPCHHTPD